MHLPPTWPHVVEKPLRPDDTWPYVVEKPILQTIPSMNILRTALIALSLLHCLSSLATEKSFGYFNGNPLMLRPPSMPADAKEKSSNSKYSDSAEWIANRQQANTTNLASAHVEVDAFRGENNGNFKYYGVKDLKELTVLTAEYDALRRIAVELSTFQSVTKDAYWSYSLSENTLPTKYVQGQHAVLSFSDYIKLRKDRKLGNYHTLSYVGRAADGRVLSRQLVQAGNVFIRTRHQVSSGYDGGLPSTTATMNYIVGKLSGEGFTPSEEVALGAASANNAPEPSYKPQIEASPTPTGVTGALALIPATDQLPARLVMRDGKPNSNVVFYLRRDGGLLKAQGKQNRYELPVRVDANGVAEVQFFYTAGALTEVQEFEVIAMNEGKKATAKVVVGLGLDFERIRAIKGQSYVSNVYAFSLGVKSRFHSRLDVATYLFNAEQSKAWGERKLGIRIQPEWLNRGVGSDIAYDWTTEIKPLPDGNGLVATDSAKEAKQPTYDGMKFSYPAIKLDSTGKHIYKVPGTVVVMQPNGVVTSKYTDEPALKNQALLVMTVDSDPDGYFKMLACSLDAQDGIQWLIWEGAKMIPVAGNAFDGVQTGAGILCKLTDGDYENAFYDFFNYTGGKALDKLGAKLKENPSAYSPKVHTAYKQAQAAYDHLMADKNDAERDRLIQKSLEQYGLTPTPAARIEDDVDPAQVPPSSSPQAPNPDFGKSVDDFNKALRDAGKDLRDLGKNLLNIFK